MAGREAVVPIDAATVRRSDLQVTILPTGDHPFINQCCTVIKFAMLSFTRVAGLFNAVVGGKCLYVVVN